MYIFTTILLFLHFNFLSASKCKYKIGDDSSTCYKITEMVKKTCPNDTFYFEQETNSVLCDATIFIDKTNIFPFDKIIEDYIRAAAKICCGPCVDVDSNSTTKDIDELADEMNRGTFAYFSDIIMPILGKKISNKVLGQSFIPVVPIETMILIMLKKSKTQIMKDLVSACVSLWPLLTICLLLAFIAGVIGWIMDTWKNEEEFPRPFLSGVYEGFWWSFVSMTTVGYGDKAPKSVIARLFSIGWILIGITICSMFTSSLTVALTESTKQSDPPIKGVDVGILENHLADAAFVVDNGGAILLYEDFQHLKESLDNNYVDVIAFDSLTMQYFLRTISDISKYHITQRDFRKEQLSYGMLIRTDGAREFFESFFNENAITLQTCINNEKNRDYYENEASDLFATSGGYFWPFFASSMIFIAMMMMVGVGVKYLQKKYLKKRQDLEKKDGGDIEEDLIVTLNILFENLKRRKDIQDLSPQQIKDIKS